MMFYFEILSVLDHISNTLSNIPNLDYDFWWLWCVKHACVCVSVVRRPEGVCLGRRRLSVWIMDEEKGARAMFKDGGGASGDLRRKGPYQVYCWIPWLDQNRPQTQNNKAHKLQ